MAWHSSGLGREAVGTTRFQASDDQASSLDLGFTAAVTSLAGSLTFHSFSIPEGKAFEDSSDLHPPPSWVWPLGLKWAFFFLSESNTNAPAADSQ